jgi:hypothetical protein
VTPIASISDLRHLGTNNLKRCEPDLLNCPHIGGARGPQQFAISLIYLAYFLSAAFGRSCRRLPRVNHDGKGSSHLPVSLEPVRTENGHGFES